jgi:hypothetical protein
VSREAIRVWIGFAGFAIFGVSWFAIFRYSLPYPLLAIGPLVFIICSSGVEWFVPLSADEQAERNIEILQEESDLRHLGFWGYSLLSISMIGFSVAVGLAVNWFNSGMHFPFLSPRTILIFSPALAVAFISLPLVYLSERRRLRKLREKIGNANTDQTNPPNPF